MLGQSAEHLAACAIGESVKHRIELGYILNHMVEDNREWKSVNRLVD